MRELRGWETLKVRLAINWIHYTPELSRLSCATLGIVGTASAQAVRLMERFVAAVPGARLERIPDAFDPSNLCQPEVFNRVLRAFLDELCSGGLAAHEAPVER